MSTKQPDPKQRARILMESVDRALSARALKKCISEARGAKDRGGIGARALAEIEEAASRRLGEMTE